jgi:hypothetical protein
MRGKRRIGFFAILMSILFAVVGSGVAHAATWTTAGVTFDSTNTDCGSAYNGKVWLKASWDHDDATDAKVRLNSSYDIAIINQSAARIPVYGWTSASPNLHSLTWISTMGPAKEVSAYRHPDNIINVAPFTSEIFSADNPDRWKRIDGVSDSDPSPHGTPMTWGTRNPALTFYTYPMIYVNGSWTYCAGGAIVLEVFYLQETFAAKQRATADKSRLLATLPKHGPIDGD